MKKLEAVKERAANPLNRSGMQVNHTLTAMRIAIERVQDDRAFLLKLVEAQGEAIKRLEYLNRQDTGTDRARLALVSADAQLDVVLALLEQPE